MSNQDRKSRLSAEQLAQLRQRATAQGKIPRRPAGCEVPLSFSQQRLWFLDQFTPGSAAYNLPSATRLVGELNVPALEQAFLDLARRHESLRTTFPTRNGQPVQVISAEPEIAFTVTDAPADDPVALDKLVRSLADACFDLARGPLWRVHLLRLAPQEHLMLFVIHHIITDDWSFSVLRQDLGHLYAAHTTGRPPELPPLPIQCADVACWEQEHLQSNELKEQLAYWQAKLAGELPVVELPTDHVRPAVQATDGADLQTMLPADLTRALKALCQMEKATLYGGLLAAFAALLHRYTGLTDLPVGTPVFGRSRAELEALIGYFSNTLVLRLDLAGRPSFRELLRRVQTTTVDAVSRQDVPFERLVEVLKPQRDLAVPPLFQVLFSLVRARPEGVTWAGLTMEAYEIPRRAAHYDLTLEAFEQGDVLRLGWVYRSDLFEARTIARVAEHLQTLLASVLAAPDRPVDEAALLPPVERELLLTEFNATAVAYDRTATVHGLFERQAARTPDAIAAVWESEAVTYDDLNRRANRLAHQLRAQGVGPEQLVGIRLERGLPMLVALLAVLKAGGAYVPLDPAYPSERLAFMAADAQLSIIIDEAYLAHGAVGSEENPAGGAGPEHPCYAIYTSGSTGRPKGAVVLHRNVVNFLLSMHREPGLTPADTLLAVTSISFDIAGLELFLPLVTGARVVIASRAAAGDGESLRSLLLTHDVTMMQATPVTWRLLLDAGWQSSPGFTMLCGGEAMPPELAERLTAGGGDLWNMYGPTETTIWSTVYPVLGTDGPVPIGRPIANTQVYVLDGQLQPVPIGVAGELYIGGEGVIRGYWNRPELTAERFVDLPQGRVYRTGDLARWRADGVLEYLGRTDFQVKLRGHRLELGETETALARLPGVTGAVVVARGAGAAMKLVAYVTGGADPAELRGQLKAHLPEYMVPAVFVPLAAFPLTPNGKVDRKALPDPKPAGPTAGFVAPGTDVERTIAAIWAEVLGLGQVGTQDNFFELGGHSLLVVQVRAQLKERLGVDLPVMELFRHTTVAALAAHISGGRGGAGAGERRPAASARQRRQRNEQGGGAVAIIGMAGRFPGAPDVAAFWQNLLNGVESIQTFTAAEDAAGLPEETPGYVRAGGFMDGVGQFDAAFFGYGPREAATMDPQQRLFLEVAWEALELAGYDAAQYPGRIGVIAGAGMNNYWLRHLAPNQALMESVGGFPVMISNDKDFVATRVAYKLGLKGPALTVQTACSTSLAATAVAVQMLQAGACEMALAGGVSLQQLDRFGYQYEQGSILSPDGHCRAFDEAAGGTVPGSGVGVVVLKLLEDAQADGDQIIAVIRGIAMNNDGSEKIGYTGPSVEGQAEVITEALAAAKTHPDSVGYIETHGTGTALGDPIEVEALTQAYRAAGASGTGTVALGAVKSNIGHLDIAAGVTGLIKAALVVKHGEVPPTLHFRAPNPKLSLESSPFYVPAQRTPWQGPTPRRAGVSSFGIGGTNVHAVLEEAPPQPPSGPGRPAELLLLSARTPSALAQAAANLSVWLQTHQNANLADVAHTLQVGRRAFPFRMAVVATTPDEAAQAIRAAARPAQVEPGDRSVVLLFPGQGAQYPGMGQGLYETEPAYRDAVDRCAAALQPHLGLDIRTLLFSVGADAGEQLKQTALAQPALFVTEYAMACLLAEWGIRPAAMIGHSLGEYVAATLAGVFRLEDALWLVAMRGKLMQAMEPGAMLALTLPEAEVTPLLTGSLSLAAVNGPAMCVVSGPTAEVEALARRVDGRRLHTSHAFHSATMEPAAERFRQLVRRVQLTAPTIPFVSNITGNWIMPEQATDPDYWARHLREPVRFGEGLLTLLAQPGRVLIETGPGQTLATFARQSAAKAVAITTTMRHPQDAQSDTSALLQGVGRLWLAGLKLDGAGVYKHQRRQRVELPTYPFERQRYWIAPPNPAQSQTAGDAAQVEAAAAVEPGLEHARPAALSTGFAAPRTEAEAQIGTVFAKHLGLAQVGIHDDFFELGGHSLLAIRVLTDIRERLGVELPARSLYERPTVASLAEALAGAHAAERIPVVPRDQPLPLSLAQERLWLLDKQFPAEAARNNLSLTYQVEGDVDVPLLEQALKQAAARHEILRTSFAEVDGQPVQIIHPEVDWTVPVIDLRHLSPAERDAELQRLMAEEDYRPFDLTRPPLLRITLIRTTEREHTLILLAHHSIFDGTSQGRLLTELTALMTGRSEELPDLPVQWADYAVWQRQRLQGEGLKPHLDYWQTKLAGNLPFVDLPTDHPRGGPERITDMIHVELAPELGPALKALALETGSTLFTVMLAAFKAVLAIEGGADEVLVGTHFANRDRPEVEPLVGYFVNLVPLRTDVSGNPTFADLVERVKTTAMGAFTHAEVPLALLLRELQPDLYISHKRAIQFTMVQYVPTAQLTLPGVEFTQRTWVRKPMHDLALAAYDMPEGLALALEYDASLFEPGTARRLLEAYGVFLAAAVANPTTPIHRLSEI
jgi:amino acid adenylation domain-containing protein